MVELLLSLPRLCCLVDESLSIDQLESYLWHLLAIHLKKIILCLLHLLELVVSLVLLEGAELSVFGLKEHLAILEVERVELDIDDD